MAKSDRARRAGTEPNVEDLKSDWRRCVSDRQSNYWTRQRLNWETRYCIWPNQSIDGRKWQARGSNKKVFPWPGASDSRVPLIDKYIREDVALLMQIWSDMRTLVRPNSPAKDAAWANRLTAMLRWLKYEEMEEAEDEAEYLANMLLERGAAALGIWWHREEQLTRETITMESLETAAQQAQMRLQAGQTGDALQLQAVFPLLIASPANDEQSVAILKTGELFSGFENKRLKKLLKDLRETGEAAFPRPIVAKNRPCIRALLWNEDIWTPPEVTWDFQSSRQVFVRELLTESDIEERARQYDWDPKYTEKALDTQQGKGTELLETTTHRSQRHWNSLGVQDVTNLYEVVCAYERLQDDDGIPGIYATTFLPGMSKDDGYATSILLDYAHGQYPFVSFQSERRSRNTDDSRGYGELASTMQRQIKRQWDLRIDRADIATLPPSHHPPSEEPDAWGPGVQVPTSQPDKYGYFEAPQYDQGSKEAEETVRKFSDEFFGRPVDEQNMVEAQLLKREMARKWMRGWKRADTQILQLCQQYMPDEFFFRVVGSEQGRGIRATREEIQGPFNVTLKFNVQDIDPEMVKPRLEMLQMVLQMDTNAIIDRSDAIVAGMELIDPGYAERLVRPKDGATQQEVEDEQDVFAKLLLGIQVDVKGDEAFMLRKQVLQQLIQNNPTAQNMIASSPNIAENVERRMKQLDFNIAQKFTNPIIGRTLGTPPSEQVPPVAMMLPP